MNQVLLELIHSLERVSANQWLVSYLHDLLRWVLFWSGWCWLVLCVSVGFVLVKGMHAARDYAKWRVP